MNLKQFEQWVIDRWPYGSKNLARKAGKGDLCVDHRVAVASLGLAGEAGEVTEHFKKAIRDGKFNKAEVVLELGDALHYLTVLAHMAGTTLEHVADQNVLKLTKRDGGYE